MQVSLNSPGLQFSEGLYSFCGVCYHGQPLVYVPAEEKSCGTYLRGKFSLKGCACHHPLTRGSRYTLMMSLQ